MSPGTFPSPARLRVIGAITMRLRRVYGPTWTGENRVGCCSCLSLMCVASLNSGVHCWSVKGTGVNFLGKKFLRATRTDTDKHGPTGTDTEAADAGFGVMGLSVKSPCSSVKVR